MTWAVTYRIDAATDAETIARRAVVMAARTIHPAKREAYQRLANAYQTMAAKARAESLHDRNC